MNYFFIALAVITGIGMICEKDKDRAKRLTVGFAVSVLALAIVVIN